MNCNFAVTRCNRNDVQEWSIAYIVERLEEAGRTQISMRDKGYSTGWAVMRWDIVRNPREDYPGKAGLSMPLPVGDAITRMDEAFEWISWIPATMMAARRVVFARALIHPLTDKHLYSWRAIAKSIETDHKFVQRLHSTGIKKIFEKGASQTPQKTA